MLVIFLSRILELMSIIIPNHRTNVGHILSSTAKLMLISCYFIRRTGVDHFFPSRRTDDTPDAELMSTIPTPSHKNDVYHNFPNHIVNDDQLVFWSLN